MQRAGAHLPARSAFVSTFLVVAVFKTRALVFAVLRDLCGSRLRLCGSHQNLSSRVIVRAGFLAHLLHGPVSSHLHLPAVLQIRNETPVHSQVFCDVTLRSSTLFAGSSQFQLFLNRLLLVKGSIKACPADSRQLAHSLDI